ncbi:alkyl hydroperoxide reductase/ Thiol specific antioxidant/ Mal allergen [Oceanithermus profundus DSM 14977]|uniref:Alkyl hydroperoxide reductase/ Thiol specific antioxidant/ Mal allergen n=1 Tax=Oceanithermus profundus (strain DSM 14977 / NBRC 100410 / VKM B-2274 / 506) TaxID=670487 RepID=E4U9F1_OCEP5|nr:redoxin domain-containing protein [Oceanithermus profundus]ADR37047.1 alkyl hydroperoxide reductase/ Thiol specific antioxidant/ Mal allergen [Oceanithermus profundus DSM 14977]
MSVNVGDPIPQATVFNKDLEPVDLAAYGRGRPLVILFFPGSFTSVCEKELCTFRDSMAAYNEVGAQVVGISVDTPFCQAAFAEKNRIDYPLLSDFNKEAIRAFGVVLPELKGLKELAQRAAFVADAKGKIRWAWIADNPGQEPPYDEVAAAVRAL